MSIFRSLSSRRNMIFLFALTGVICVLTAYVFLISSGTWTDWPTNTTYYDQLAVSFGKGDLSLGVVPDPALLALPNPYDPDLRADIPYPQDVSLYKGKFYIYFGPIPAVLLAVLKIFFQGEIGDQYLVFAFASGLLLVQSMFLGKVLSGFFPDVPAWLIFPSIVVMGLISPFGWMISLSSVYNASILGGQFFFLWGLYLVFDAFKYPSQSKPKFALTGALWVCAVGTRMTLVIPIVFMLFIMLVWFYYRYREHLFSSEAVKVIFSFTLPFLLGAISLGWYNWARFDSVFEFGTTYQLAGPNLQKHKDELFSPLYVANNTYNYFLIKPEIKKNFPFLGPIRGRNDAVISSINLPTIYFSQETAGLFYTAPFILFAIPSLTLFLNLRQKRLSHHEKDKDDIFHWVVISLLGSVLASLMFFLFFFWAGVRYQAEFIPLLTALSVLGFWQVYHFISLKPFLKIPYILLALILIVVTIINSNLIAMAINSAHYRELNPVLWNHLTKFFNKLLMK